MIIIVKYKLIYDKDDSAICYVKSEEKSICPICGSPHLKIIGSRKRNAWQSDGEKIIMIIRRLRCINCLKIHHELPDKLVPYKRYTSSAIETVLDNTTEIYCENGSIYRLKKWFSEIESYIAGCLSAVANRLNLEVNFSTGPAHRRIKSLVGESRGWLARTVRTIVNTNNWPHTRSAFMS